MIESPSKTESRNLTPSSRWVNAGLWAALCFFTYTLILPYLVMIDGSRFFRYPLSGNEQSHLALARAIVEKGSFRLDSIGYRWGDLATYQGHHYSNKPPGFAFLLVPPYAVFFHLLYPDRSPTRVPNFLFWVPVLLGSVCVGLFYLFATELGLPARSASFSTLVAGFGTIVMVYSAQLTNNVPTALFGLLTLFLSIRFHRSGRAGYAISASFAAAYAVTVNYAAVVLVLPSVLFLVWGFRLLDKRNLWTTVFASIAAAMIPMGVLAFYHYQCFDSIFATGYSHYQPPAHIRWDSPAETYSAGRFLEGFWGLTFSPGKGIFVYTPVLLFSIPGFVLAFREKKLRIEHLVIGSTILLYLFLFFPYRYWFGGHSFGPRHALPIIPLLALYAGFYFNRADSRTRRLLVLLVIPSIAVHLLLGLANHIPAILDLTWVGEEGPLESSRITSLYTDLVPLIISQIRYLPSPGAGLMGFGLFAVLKWISLVLIFVTLWTLFRRIDRPVSPGGYGIDKLLGFVD